MTWGTHCGRCGWEDCSWERDGTCEGMSRPLLRVSHRLDALRRRSRRDYWTGVAVVTGLALMQVPFIYAAWRLFCVP